MTIDINPIIAVAVAVAFAVAFLFSWFAVEGFYQKRATKRTPPEIDSTKIDAWLNKLSDDKLLLVADRMEKIAQERQDARPK
jgi:hypothetical protein